MVGLVGSLWSADVVDHSWHYWCNFHFLCFKWKKGRLNKRSSAQHSHTHTQTNTQKKMRRILRYDIDTVTRNWLFICKHLQISQRFNQCLKNAPCTFLFLFFLIISAVELVPHLDLILPDHFHLAPATWLILLSNWCYIHWKNAARCAHISLLTVAFSSYQDNFTLILASVSWG